VVFIMRTLTCPRGHAFDSDSNDVLFCPECGVEMSVADSFNPDAATFKPPDELPPLPGPTPIDPKALIPFQLTGYEILVELGRGGMGVVYKARQISLNRLVALKMMTAGIWGSAQEAIRFKMEADALAQLHHPNIVQIHEIGAKDGQPFLALEFVEGGSLDRRLAGTPTDPQVAAQFMEVMARAVHFAHERKIVHRDLKPGNILLQPAQPKETDLRTAVPKITDFGLAKRLDQESDQTRTGAVVGTPSYMAPEQAASKLDEIGPASDVYALGAILYEMLTGRPPFHGVTPVATLQQVLTEEPVAPRRLQSGVPVDLETICLKCLAKDPARRYASAAALADDLARFQAGHPILARPTSWSEHTIKWIKRRPALAGLLGASAVAALLLVGLLVGLYYNALLQDSLTETQKQRDRADNLARLDRRHRYIHEMGTAQTHWNKNRVPELLEILNTKRADDAEYPDFRSFEWHYLSGLGRSELRNYARHEHPVACVAFSPTENLAASAGGASTLEGAQVRGVGEVHLWDPDTGATKFVLQGHAREVNAVAFSPDGAILASADSDRKVMLWNVAAGERRRVLEGHTAAVTALAFHPDGRRLASASRNGIIKIQSVAPGMSERELVLEGAVLSSVAFSHDGMHLLAGGHDPRQGNAGEVREWDIETGKVVNTYRGHDGAVTALLFRPRSDSFLSASEDRTIRVWNLGKKEPVQTLHGHGDRVTALALDRRGTRLASASADLTALVWDLAAGKELFSRKGHTDVLRGVAFSRDGKRLLTAAADRTVKVWHADGPQEYVPLAGHERQVTDLVFSLDGDLLASAGEDHTIRLWRTATGETASTLSGHQAPVRCLALNHAKGKAFHLVSAGDDGAVRFWDANAAKEVFRLEAPRQQLHALALSPDGTHVAAAGASDGDFQAAATIALWNIAQKGIVRTLAGHPSRITALAFSPDGKRLVSANADAGATLKIWETDTGAELVSIPLPDATEPRIAWSPDGKSIAIANGDLDKGTVRILDGDGLKEKLVLTGHAGAAKALAFTPDGERLVVTAGRRAPATQVKLFDVVTGQEVLTLPGPTGLILCFAFSRDGKQLAAGGGVLFPERGEVVLWQCHHLGR
jgi:WD40 repeat protein/serine/threonine protein kinase